MVPKPASQLLGMSLPDDWKVVEHLKKPPCQTGGRFSEGYIVARQDGTRAFLKALDYSGAMTSKDPARALEALTKAYNFERDLLSRCRKMDRVVKALADGSVRIQSESGEPVVQYLILEFADCGDVRKYLEVSQCFDAAWLLRSLHHISTGLKQLHSKSIAHQDLKPSNVLVFDNTVSKIADLGRASQRGEESPHENLDIAGDLNYAPPELLYGHVVPDWNARRIGCDVYLLGGMIVYFFAQANITAMILQEMDPSYRPDRWEGNYSQVLPYVQAAFERSLALFHQSVEQTVQHLASELLSTVRGLCDPDPERRPLSLERHVTHFDLLARREEWHLARAIR